MQPSSRRAKGHPRRRTGVQRTAEHLAPKYELSFRYVREGSGIKLRMAMVSLESGALKYTTESGAVLLDGELSDPSIPPQLGLIIDGMLASTAIPGFFRMRKI